MIVEAVLFATAVFVFASFMYGLGFKDAEIEAEMRAQEDRRHVISGLTNALLSYKSINNELREENDSYRALLRTID